MASARSKVHDQHSGLSRSDGDGDDQLPTSDNDCDTLILAHVDGILLRSLRCDVVAFMTRATKALDWHQTPPDPAVEHMLLTNPHGEQGEPAARVR